MLILIMIILFVPVANASEVLSATASINVTKLASKHATKADAQTIPNSSAFVILDGLETIAH